MVHLQEAMASLQVVLVNPHTQVKVIFSQSLIFFFFFFISDQIYHHKFFHNSRVMQTKLLGRLQNSNSLSSIPCSAWYYFCEISFPELYLNPSSHHTSYQFTLIEGSRCLLFHGEQPNLTNFLFRRFNNPIVIDCLTFAFSSGTSSLWTATAAGFFRCMFIYLLIMFAGISLYFFRNCIFCKRLMFSQTLQLTWKAAKNHPK